MVRVFYYLFTQKVGPSTTFVCSNSLYMIYWTFFRLSQYIWFDKFLWDSSTILLSDRKKEAFFTKSKKRYPITQQKIRKSFKRIYFWNNNMMNILHAVSYHVVKFLNKNILIMLSWHKMNRRKGQRHITKIYILLPQWLKLLKLAWFYIFEFFLASWNSTQVYVIQEIM